jgi:hypothetical protein
MSTDGTDCRLSKVTSVRLLLAAVGSKTPACLKPARCKRYIRPRCKGAMRIYSGRLSALSTRLHRH